MKKIVLFLLLAAALGAAAQQQPNLGLIPTPQRVENIHPPIPPRGGTKGGCYHVGGGGIRVKEVRVDTLPVAANVEQAYQLVVEPRRVTLRYVGEEGRRNGILTLEQLKQLYDDAIPCCTITDWPAYRWRGWMDDISRGPVPHQAFRQKQWQRLHALKFNFCNYYTEHTLYQPEFPDLAPAYAAECTPHPDEVINLQLFAHAEKTLRVPFYQHLMDGKVNFNPGVEETYGFLKKRIAAAYKRYPFDAGRPPFFIINCDETEQLGTGRAKKLVDSLGADQVYVDFINRCYQLVKETGNPRIAMWGDIVAKNPAMMKQLPKDMVYIMWAYEPLDSFTHLIKPFKEQGNPFRVAASTGHSATMTSTPQRYIKNIANLFRDGYRDGAEGAMLTCWDDNGEALFDNSWHAQYWAAEMAWNPLKTDDPEELRQREAQFNENYERLFYGGHTPQSALRAASSPNLGEQHDSKTATASSSPNLGEGDRPEGVGEECVFTKQLYAVGALMYEPAVGDWYTSAALMEPLLNFNPDNTGDAMHERIEHVSHLIDAIHIDSAANPHAYYALKRISATLDKCRLRLYISDTALYPEIPYTIPEYLQELFDLKREYLRLWDQENGDYERYIVMNRYDDLAREVLELDRHVFMTVGHTPQSALRAASSPNLGEQRDSKTATANSSPKLGEGDRREAVGEECVYPLCSLRTLYNDRPIYYTLDGSEPNKGSTLYTGPIPLERSATIKAISYNEYGEGVVSEQYLLSHKGMGAKIKLNTSFSIYKAIYSGGGENALIDGQLGSNTTYADGHWQGYWGDSIDAVIDFSVVGGLPAATPHEVTMRFMQNTFDWILAPTEIKVYASQDGESWTLVADKHFAMDPRETGMRLKQYTVPLDTQALKHSNIQAIRVVVPNPGPLPDWHPAPGQPSYLFTDEIIIR